MTMTIDAPNSTPPAIVQAFGVEPQETIATDIEDAILALLRQPEMPGQGGGESGKNKKGDDKKKNEENRQQGEDDGTQPPEQPNAKDDPQWKDRERKAQEEARQQIEQIKHDLKKRQPPKSQPKNGNEQGEQKQGRKEKDGQDSQRSDEEAFGDNPETEAKSQSKEAGGEQGEEGEGEGEGGRSESQGEGEGQGQGEGEGEGQDGEQAEAGGAGDGRFGDGDPNGGQRAEWNGFDGVGEDRENEPRILSNKKGEKVETILSNTDAIKAMQFAKSNFGRNLWAQYRKNSTLTTEQMFYAHLIAMKEKFPGRKNKYL